MTTNENTTEEMIRIPLTNLKLVAKGVQDGSFHDEKKLADLIRLIVAPFGFVMTKSEGADTEIRNVFSMQVGRAKDCRRSVSCGGGYFSFPYIDSSIQFYAERELLKLMIEQYEAIQEFGEKMERHPWNYAVEAEERQNACIAIIYAIEKEAPKTWEIDADPEVCKLAGEDPHRVIDALLGKAIFKEKLYRVNCDREKNLRKIAEIDAQKEKLQEMRAPLAEHAMALNAQAGSLENLINLPLKECFAQGGGSSETSQGFVGEEQFRTKHPALRSGMVA